MVLRHYAQVLAIQRASASNIRNTRGCLMTDVSILSGKHSNLAISVFWSWVRSSTAYLGILLTSWRKDRLKSVETEPA